MGTELWILIGVVAVLVIYVIYMYNKLVSYQTQYENGFAQIETQLKRRHDLHLQLRLLLTWLNSISGGLLRHLGHVN